MSNETKDDLVLRSPRESTQLEKLLRAKLAAGLPEADARDVLAAQAAHDAALAKTAKK